MAKVLRRRNRIRSKSPEQSRRDRLYAPLAAHFKARNSSCECCSPLRTLRGLPWAVPNLTQDIHHSHGKIGALLFFFPWFKAVCRSCHDWIEANKAKAREIGMECQPGEFNTQAKESVWLAKWKGGRTYVSAKTEAEAADRAPAVNAESFTVKKLE